MYETQLELVVDDRGHVALGPLVDKNSVYIGRRFDDGSILLEPAAAVPRGKIPGVIEPKL